jgi:hypothetical protein
MIFLLFVVVATCHQRKGSRTPEDRLDKIDDQSKLSIGYNLNPEVGAINPSTNGKQDRKGDHFRSKVNPDLTDKQKDDLSSSLFEFRHLFVDRLNGSTIKCQESRFHSKRMLISRVLNLDN